MIYKYIDKITWHALTALLLFLNLMTAATAQTMIGIDKNAAKKQIQNIMQDEIFNKQREVRKIKLNIGENSTAKFTFNWAGIALGDIFKIIAWTVVFIFLVFVIYHSILNAKLTRNTTLNQAATPPQTLFGLDVRRSSLPEDIVATATELWRRGETTEAISILYRGALAHLITTNGIDIKASATEGDCLSIVQKKCSQEKSNYFSLLVQAWQRMAYGHQVLNDTLFAALCEQWPRCFEAEKK